MATRPGCRRDAGLTFHRFCNSTKPPLDGYGGSEILSCILKVRILKLNIPSGWFCCSAPARRLGSAQRGGSGSRWGCLSLPSPVPKSPSCSLPAGTCLSSSPTALLWGWAGDSGCLRSVGPLTGGKALFQRPPFNGDLPKLIQRFQVTEVRLELASAGVVPRVLPAGMLAPIFALLNNSDCD